MTTQNTHIPDGWTDRAGYIARYQTEAQVREVVQLLRLSTAEGLVDIGCGNGAFAVAAAAQNPRCRVWAVDPLESAIAECRRRAAEAGVANLQAEIASADRVPLPDSSVDRVLTRNVLHHVACADAAFAETSRVLRTDGRVVLETPCNLGDEQLGGLISDIHMLMDDSHRRTYHHPDAIVCGLSSHGIVAESVTTWPYAPGMSVEQVALVRQHAAESVLSLHESDDDRWRIKLNIVRVIGRKK